MLVRFCVSRTGYFWHEVHDQSISFPLDTFYIRAWSGRRLRGVVRDLFRDDPTVHVVRESVDFPDLLHSEFMTFGPTAHTRFMTVSIDTWWMLTIATFANTYVTATDSYIKCLASARNIYHV